MASAVAETEAATLDPIKVEVIRGSLSSAQREAEALLERTAMSPGIREKHDYFVGFLDAGGRLVAGTKLPLFGNILGPVLKHYAVEEMRPGDTYWYNDCYGSDGSVSHSPDQVFVRPSFLDGRLIGFAHSWAHFTDIGGSEVGSLSPDARDIFQEGVIIPPVRLHREGRLNDELFRILVANSRFPEMVRGDLRALLASVTIADRRIVELAGRVGADTLEEGFDQLIRQTREAVRSRIKEAFPPGTYRFADAVDGDGRGGGPFTVRMTMSVGDRITIDTSETDDQSPGPINFLMHPSVPAMMLGMYFLENDKSLLLNHGAIEAVDEVIVRKGSLIQPSFPAPLGQRSNTMARVQSVCSGLVNVASGGKSVAASAIYVVYILRGQDPKTGKAFHESGGVAVGHGARPFADGIDGVYYVAQQNYPVEFVETSYPLRVTSYGINGDSGGPGYWRGGCGVVRDIELLVDDATVALRMDNVSNPPWGVNGGRSGRGGRFVLNPGTADEKELPRLRDGIRLKRGDVLRVETVGGGGWGHPFDRDPYSVISDVAGGFVSLEGARTDYGVVTDDTGRLDLPATEAHRKKFREPAGLFHRGGYYSAAQWWEATKKGEQCHAPKSLT